VQESRRGSAAVVEVVSVDVHTTLTTTNLSRADVAADLSQRCEGGVVGGGQGVDVFAGGGDGAVAESLTDDFDVGAAGKQPRRVGVA
jgi:hypothetical protein